MKLYAMNKIVLALFLLMLGACASKPEDTSVLSAEEIYVKGYQKINETEYTKAATYFEKVETEHPYSKWAVKAKLMGAYAYYKDKKYDDALMSLERFIKYHPGNKDIAYAYYLRGICFYDQITPSEKDQSNTKMAHDALEAVTVLFPDTEYAKDAQNKLKLTLDHQSAQEMEVGRYYLKNKNYLAALNRFDTVVKNYQTTAHIEEALYREVEIYTALGLSKEAEKMRAVLEYNYPKNKWTAKAQKLLN